MNDCGGNQMAASNGELLNSVAATDGSSSPIGRAQIRRNPRST